jgi:hypothetical protein
VRHLVSSIYPAVRQHRRTQVLPAPILDDRALETSVTKPLESWRQGSALKVALLGNVTVGKGGDLFAPAAFALAGAPVEFHVFGRIDDAYRHLEDKRQFPNVFVHGQYLADELPAELLQCDVSVHVSIWPETYCLTLSEAWQNRIVPIVTDIGALGERVRNRVNGLKIRVGEEGDLINAIRLLAEDRDLLASLRANISRDLYSTVTPHVQALTAEYHALLRELAHDAEPEASRRAPGIAELGIVLQSPSWFQNGPAPRVTFNGGASSRSALRSIASAVIPAQVRSGIAQRTKFRSVQNYYRNHGFKNTAGLVLRHARRILWKR